jgi:epoxyqueuosine reductase
VRADASEPARAEPGAASAGLKRRVVAAALEAGASAVAVVGAARDERAGARLEAAFARGDFATWGYDAAYAARAADPGVLLPGARSVVCIALAYAHEPPAGRGPLTGRVSNYAWSSDYHARLRALLERIAGRIDELAGAPATRVCCDTAPLAERAYAERAGLGWVGKHTNLIVPGAGSYVFLGEILTTLELEPDRPSKKSCGSCTRCVTACPTQALRGDYTIDATRCISDLTQRTGAIPRALRPLLGDWIWGCDLCQAVCPPTRRASPRADRAFAPAGAQAAFPGLLALLRLRSGEFKRRYRATAMGWRGAAVLRRNAAVALGNALDRAAVPALEDSLRDDPHPLVRGHAAWALGRIGSPRALAALRAALAGERDAGVRDEIRAALAAWSAVPGARANGPPGNLRAG